MEFIVRAKYWKKGAKSYGDSNIIHYSPSAALRFGLEGIIAPGAWLAANIQGRLANISSIKQIKFSDNAYDGDILNVDVTPWKLGKGRDYIFTRDGGKILQLNGVKSGEYSDAPEIMTKEDVFHVYDFVPTKDRQKRFVNSIGIRYDGNFPNMYIAATAAPALLSLGREENFIGVHASQTFDVHGEFNDSPVKTLIKKGRVKKSKEGSIHFFNQQWVQDGVIKATGRASALLLDSSMAQKPRLVRDFLVDTAYRIGADKFYDMKSLYANKDTEAA